MSQAAGLRLLLKPSGPLGYEKPFYMPDASLLLTRGDMNFSDRFQLGSFCGTSDHVFNLYFCRWRLEIETLICMIWYYHTLISEEGDLLCEDKFAERIGCDFCKEGFGVCSSVTVYIAQELPGCLQDLIALSVNTEKLPLP